MCELLPDADLRDAVAPLADGVISVGGAPASCSYESDDQLTDMVVRIEHGYSAVPLARELCASGAAVADVGEDAWWCPETGVLAVAADGYSIEVQIASLRMDAEGLLPTSETLSAVAAEVASIALAEIPDDSTGDGGCTALDTDDVAEALGAEFRTGMAPAGSGADEACSFERADTFGVLTVLVYAGADRYDDLASQMESAQPVPGFDRAALDEEGSALAVACDDHAVLLHWFELETDPGAGERLVDLATTTCANMS